jgi:hypothetical protein
VSASLEAYLARLYLDAAARRAFAADPRGAATRAGLDERDVAALEQVDRVGLELTARSLRAKRATRPRRSWLARLLACWHGGRDMAPQPPNVRSTPAKPGCSSVSNMSN